MSTPRSTLLLSLSFAACSPALATVDYMKQVKPLLQVQCVKCHGASSQKGKLKLDTAAAAINPNCVPPVFSD